MSNWMINWSAPECSIIKCRFREWLWVQAFLQVAPNMSANIKNFKIALGISNPHFWTNLVKRNFRCLHSYLDPLVLKVALIFGPTYDGVCTHIWTDLWPSLHSYLDPLVMKFALIYGPYCDQVCTHIWTDLLWSLHSYLDPLVKKFALIIGPPRYSLKSRFGVVWFILYETKSRFWSASESKL